MAYLEEAIIEGCKRGEPQFQELLYAKYSAKMMAICTRYAKTTFEAEDVFQEAFVKVFHHIESYQAGTFDGWMKRIFVNTAINNYRRNAKRYNQQGYEDDNLMPEEPEIILSGISTNELLDIINQLPEGYRLVFNMSVIEGYSHKEIGEMLHIAEGTSKSQLAKAKTYLKKLISIHLPEVYANR